MFVVLIGLARYRTFAYRSIQNFDEDLMGDAKLVASRLRIDPDGFNLVAGGLSPGDVLTLEEVRPYILLGDSQGRMFKPEFHSRYMQNLVSRGGLEGVLGQKSGFGQASAPDGRNYRFASLVVKTSGNGDDIVLHLARPMDALTDLLREYRSIYLFSVPLILAVSVPVGWFLAGRALRPFEQIAKTAEQITSTNLSTRIVSRHAEEEVQRLVQAFNAMVGRLNESFQQMRKFNADAAHELRTPLAILQGENEIALRSPGVPEEIQSVLTSNLEELGRLTRMVNDMLTLAEADAGGQVLNLKPVRLVPLLGDLVEQMRVLALDRNISLSLLESPDVVVEADSLWLSRALLNLLDNAIKYSKDNGKIEVWVREDHNSACLGIRDDGIGIAPEDLPHIFDRLYRADPARTRSSGGAGLGLALVKWIVEVHRGQVSVRSEVDKGTVFEVTLPIEPAEIELTPALP